MRNRKDRMRKLSLKRETVRELAVLPEAKLEAVRGGVRADEDGGKNTSWPGG